MLKKNIILAILIVLVFSPIKIRAQMASGCSVVMSKVADSTEQPTEFVYDIDIIFSTPKETYSIYYPGLNSIQVINRSWPKATDEDVISISIPSDYPGAVYLTVKDSDGQTMCTTTNANPNINKPADFDQFNPLKMRGEDTSISPVFDTPADVINRFLLFAFPIAGLILFVMIVWGGFDMLTKATTKKSIEDGKKRITNAVIGFILLFVAYWLVQIIEVVFGVKIL